MCSENLKDVVNHGAFHACAHKTGKCSQRHLPDELWLIILRMVPYEDNLSAVRGVSRQLRRVAWSIRHERYHADKQWLKQEDMPWNARWIVWYLDQVRHDADEIFWLSVDERDVTPLMVDHIDTALAMPDSVADIRIEKRRMVPFFEANLKSKHSQALNRVRKVWIERKAMFERYNEYGIHKAPYMIHFRNGDYEVSD